MLKKTLVVVLISISCLMHLQVVLCGNWFTHSKLPTHDPSARFEHDDGLFDDCLSSVSVNEPSDEPQNYGVVVDCGSSGSRAHIYQWNAMLNKTVDYQEMLSAIAPSRDPKTNEILSKKFSPGLSSYADKNLTEVQDYIKKIADYISSHIPADRQRFTVIYVLATAGMRLLDEDTQDAMMLQVKDYILLHYNFFDVKTSVISGSDEGMYQWISINAKAKRFLSPSTNVQTSTFGVIEMGGASVQVAYQLRNGMRTSISNSLALDARKVFLEHLVEPLISRQDDPENTYKLYSTTFLGFGSNSALEAYWDLRIHNSYERNEIMQYLDRAMKNFRNLLISKKHRRQEKNAIEDPCSPKGKSTFVTKPRRMLGADEWKKIGFIVDENESKTFQLEFLGTGDYHKCKKVVLKLLEEAKMKMLNCKPEEVDLNKCSMSLIETNFIPFYSLNMLAIGDFYHTTKLLKVDGEYDHDLVAKKTEDFCNMSEEQLKRKYPSTYKSETETNLHFSRLFQACFKAVWIDTLLVKGFGLSPKKPLLKTIGKIRCDSPEWTLGAVLSKSLAIDEATERRGAEVIESDEEDVEVEANEDDNQDGIWQAR